MCDTVDLSVKGTLLLSSFSEHLISVSIAGLSRLIPGGWLGPTVVACPYPLFDIEQVVFTQQTLFLRCVLSVDTLMLLPLTATQCNFS